MTTAQNLPKPQPEPIHIISLGAGVQSSTMSLMAAAGEIKPMPVAAIFADTQAEPQSVYRWLDWLEKQLPFPVHRVTAGNLTEAALRVRTSKKSGKGYWKPNLPLFSKSLDGRIKMNSRHCTRDFKLVPLYRKMASVREAYRSEQLHCWIGISTDEALRCKDSRLSWVTNRWPLIEMGISRNSCISWMQARGFPKPPRSACVYCPYHHNREWARLKNEEPEAFNRAIDFERQLSQIWPKFTAFNALSVPFLHRSCLPLDRVDFSTTKDVQLDMFNNECEGMCGV